MDRNNQIFDFQLDKNCHIKKITYEENIEEIKKALLKIIKPKEKSNEELLEESDKKQNRWFKTDFGCDLEKYIFERKINEKI